MMNYLKLLADFNCTDADVQKIVGLVRWVFNAICIAIPVIIIILIVIDITKVATAGNVDDKMKKEAGQKAVTRLIYAVVVFLVPTIVNLIFKMLPASSVGNTFVDCWNGGTTETRT